MDENINSGASGSVYIGVQSAGAGAEANAVTPVATDCRRQQRHLYYYKNPKEVLSSKHLGKS
jgi:hypothetical protein